MIRVAGRATPPLMINLLDLAPDDLAATVFHSLGIRLDQEMHDAQGRPLPVCTGKPVLGLF